MTDIKGILSNAPGYWIDGLHRSVNPWCGSMAGVIAESTGRYEAAISLRPPLIQAPRRYEQTVPISQKIHREKIRLHELLCEFFAEKDE